MPRRSPPASGVKIQRHFGLPGSLAAERPDLAIQWHQTANRLTPSEIAIDDRRSTIFWRCSREHVWKTSVAARVDDGSCPRCERVRAQSIAVRDPDLAADWHPSLNGDLGPQHVTEGSQARVWWMCEEGHEWSDRVIDRTHRGRGCPTCSPPSPRGRRGTLLEERPDLAVQWHPTKNGKRTPEVTTLGEREPAWWKGSCGHVWQATIRARAGNNTGCPRCARRRDS